MNPFNRVGRAFASVPGTAWAALQRAAGQLTGSWHRLDLDSLPVTSGVTVNEKALLSLAAGWACINAIATDISFLPLVVLRKMPNGRRMPQESDPRYGMLHDTPDGARTSMRYRQAVQAKALGWGNAVCEIVQDGDGFPVRLLPPQGGCATQLSNGAVWYRLDNGRQLPAERVVHIASMGPDGLNGWTPVQYHRETVGLTIASVRFGASLFGNGAFPGGFLKTPKRLTKEAAHKLISQFEKVHRGPDKAFKLALLEEGVTWERAAVNPQDAQYLALRAFQVAEICRIYRVPPHKIMDFSQMQLASAGVEAANLDYLTTTIVPWCFLWEQELNLKLFTGDERRAGYYVKHNVGALLRGDMKTKAEFYTAMVQNGIYTRDEVRAFEDMDPIGPDLGGDKYTVQSQFVELKYVGATVAKDPPSGNSNRGEFHDAA